jgi:hypothetical protein
VGGLATVTSCTTKPLTLSIRTQLTRV